PRRAVVHHPPGVRDPARPDHLHAVRVVPPRRARTRARRPDARGPAARPGRAELRALVPGPRPGAPPAVREPLRPALGRPDLGRGPPRPVPAHDQEPGLAAG